MDELVERTCEALDIAPDTAREALGTLLSVVRRGSNDADFRELVDRLPGARSLMSFADASAKQIDEGGGIIGGSMETPGALGSRMGRGRHIGLNRLARLPGIGLEAHKIVGLRMMFVDFVHDNAGPALADRVRILVSEAGEPD